MARVAGRPLPDRTGWASCRGGVRRS